MVLMTKSIMDLQALARNTQDVDLLYKITEELVTRLQTSNLQLAFSRDRVSKLTEQVDRQSKMLDQWMSQR